MRWWHVSVGVGLILIVAAAVRYRSENASASMTQSVYDPSGAAVAVIRETPSHVVSVVVAAVGIALVLLGLLLWRVRS